MTDEPKFPPDDLRVDYGSPAKMSDPGFMRRLDERKQEEEARAEQRARERAERVRRDALARFVPFPDGQFGFVCPACSAVVMDPAWHLDWHGSLAETAAQASRAAWMSTPIR